jgi:hypothetical protein
MPIVASEGCSPSRARWNKARRGHSGGRRNATCKLTDAKCYRGPAVAESEPLRGTTLEGVLMARLAVEIELEPF